MPTFMPGDRADGPGRRRGRRSNFSLDPQQSHCDTVLIRIYDYANSRQIQKSLDKRCRISYPPNVELSNSGLSYHMFKFYNLEDLLYDV